MTLLAHERHDAALAYIAREAERDAERKAARDEKRSPRLSHERSPLGGLTLDQFRMARIALARQRRIKQVRGRWIPA